MNSYQEGFRTDFWGTLFNLTGRIWLKITLAHVIYTLVSLAFVTVLGIGAFNEAIQSQLSNPDTFSDPDAMMKFFQSNDIKNMLPDNFIFLFSMLAIVIIFMGSWNFNFALIAADAHVKDKNLDFTSILKKSFDSGIFKIIGVSILLYVTSFMCFFIAGTASSLIGAMGFFLFIAAFLFLLKFSLIFPAFIIGNHSLTESFSFSFHHITWIRSLKIFGIAILSFFGLLILSIITMLITFVIALIPFVGPLIQMAFSILFGGVLLTILTTALVGLYYRYSEDIETNENVPSNVEEA